MQKSAKDIMYRLIAAVLLAALLCVCATPAVAEEAAIAMAVTNHSANMRESASAKADVLKKYPSGTAVEVLEELESEGVSWYRIRITEDGSEGYMRDFLLEAVTQDEVDLAPYIAQMKTDHKADLKYISEGNLIKLAKLMRDYTITMHFDGVGFGYNGDFDKCKLPKDKINTAIEYTYDTLQLLGTDDTTHEVIGRSCNDVYSAVNCGFYYKRDSQEIIIDYSDNLSEAEIIDAITEELSSAIIYNNKISLDTFRSYNKFDKYGRWEGGTWLDEYQSMIFDSDEDRNNCFFDAGLLSGAGYEEVDDDMSDYFQGLCLGIDNYWGFFHFYHTIRNKTFALIDELSRVNSLWTYEFFYNLSNPYSIRNGGMNGVTYTAQEFFELSVDLASD